MSDNNPNALYEEVNAELLRRIKDEGEIINVSDRFYELKTNAERVDFIYALLDKYSIFPKLTPDGKSDELSVKFRQQGNEKFKFKKDEEALILYTKSAGYAVVDSEAMSFAYANRSAVLFQGGLYRECLEDIERALNLSHPENIHQKLLIRKEKAENLVKTQKYTFTLPCPVPSIPEDDRHNRIICASKAIDIEESPKTGRGVIAARDIKIGEIIAVENPFCSILIDKFYTHCHECLKLCYNLIPCSNCTQTFYCSDNCLTIADEYHKYECRILLTLSKLEIIKPRLTAMKIAFKVARKLSKMDYSPVKLGEEYRSDRYREIHHLVTNIEKRSVSDIFDRCSTATVIYYLVKTYSTFLDNQNKTVHDVVKDLLVRHLQTMACNFHTVSEYRDHQKCDDIAAGAYSFLSLFNHSCAPNVTRVSYGPTIVSVAVESIAKGEQCFDIYSQHFSLISKDARQQKLAKQYFFRCICRACKNNYPMFKDLPLLPNKPEMDMDDYEKLVNGGIDDAKTILKKTAEQLTMVEKNLPNKNWAELQEVLKQCLELFTNIVRPF